jgi:hypothetical protein
MIIKSFSALLGAEIYLISRHTQKEAKKLSRFALNAKPAAAKLG